MELPAEIVDRVLDVWPVARLATQGPDGPHLVPIVFARSGGCLWSPVDGKPKRGGELARVRNVLARPRAALLIDRYDPEWSRLWWVRVDVEVAVVRPADPVADVRVAGAERALLAKYPQHELGQTAALGPESDPRLTPLYSGVPTLLRMSLVRVSSWCASEAAAGDIG